MEDAYSKQRRRLLEEIARGVTETSSFLGKDRLDPAVIAALIKAPRHEFVPESARVHAYENRPLPIGRGQTISQPYIVAIMTDMLRLTPRSHVLEIGAGCGYQAAVLAEIAARVVTLERVAELADSAKRRLARLGYTNIYVAHANGARGWAAEAPYDAIIVTAAAAKSPERLLAQLRPGGRMAIPLGPPDMTQSLTLFEKDAEGKVSESCHLPVAFVPLIASVQQ